MTTLILILHVLTALLFLGPVTVAVSTFHAQAVQAHNGVVNARGAARLLHKITRTYGFLSLTVPMLGIGVLLSDLSYLKEGRFHASIALSVVAWAVLFFLIIPRQQKIMAALGLDEDEDAVDSAPVIADWQKAKKQLSMFGGIFSALWVVVAVLMVI